MVIMVVVVGGGGRGGCSELGFTAARRLLVIHARLLEVKTRRCR